MKTDECLLEGSWHDENTPSIVSKSMFYYIQSVGHYLASKNYKTNRRDYNSMLLIHTMGGEGVLQYRNKTYKIKKNQVFIIDCIEQQFYGTGESGFWEFDYIHFNGSESRSYVARIMDNGGPVFRIERDSIISECIKRIHATINKKDKRVDIIVSKTIIEILTELLLKGCGTEELQDSRIPLSVQNAVRIIENSYNRPMSMDELSKEICVSKYHMSRLFKKHTGFSPYEYLIKQRLNQAKILLKTTDCPVGEISRKVGFESISHFIKMFSRYEKTTPLKFRGFWR